MIALRMKAFLKRFRKTLCLIVVALLFVSSFSQNGKIISANEVTQPDSIKQARIQRIRYYQKVFDSTKLTDITYLSEGLKIKGFIAEPKAPGKYPCVIFCRGGNRDFGKIDWLTTAFLTR